MDGVKYLAGLTERVILERQDLTRAGLTPAYPRGLRPDPGWGGRNRMKPELELSNKLNTFFLELGTPTNQVLDLPLVIMC